MRQGILPIQIVTTDKDDEVTAHAGLVVVKETIQALGLDAILDQELPSKSRANGFTDAEKVQSIVLLMAAGGECLQDIDVLLADKALQKLIETRIPSADTLLTFLYSFHSEELIQKAQQERSEGTVAYIPEESERLQGLGRANYRFVNAVATLLPEKSSVATCDHDATIQESHNKQAKAHYKSGRGYQPSVIYWGELDLILADEYRDGNVPAAMENLPLIQQAFAALPPCVKQRYFRADSACYEHNVLNWLTDPERCLDAAGSIGFAISADMGKKLRKCCCEVPESEWKLVQDREDETVTACDVAFCPKFWANEKSPLRFVAVRIKGKQGRLFDEGTDTKYLAVVSNRTDMGPVELLQWHRQKAGTIELVHDVTKNELAAAVPPCGRFGANAAWYRLSMLTFNVLSAMKQLALKDEFAKARPKRLRFRILGVAGKVISHAHQLFLRIGEAVERIAGLIEARARLLKARDSLAQVS